VRESGKKKGLYPQLTILGTLDHHSPASVSEIAQIAVALSSLEEAVSLLRSRGREIGIKTLRRITYHFSSQARQRQQIERSTAPTGYCSGKRCAISLDGGRIRIRKNKRGPKTKKNRSRYHSNWREPKLLHIWIIKEDGMLDRSSSPWIDGTMQGPDTVFMLLSYYLAVLQIHTADQILFIADGAHWIWNRVATLIEKLGIDPKKVYQLVDFYHAVEHLSAVVTLCKKWSAKKRRQWIHRNKNDLWNGNIEKVVAAVRMISRGRNGKLITRERNYFEGNIDRMCYANNRSLHLPIGSGPMESAIRRVINLRMKGNGIFWLEENADAMLMLRSFYKAGRWDDLVSLALDN
jgi:hypothetical protein